MYLNVDTHQSRKFLKYIIFLFVRDVLSVKNYAGRQPRRVPIALHSNQSAMALLHTIPPALLITETGLARYVKTQSE